MRHLISFEIDTKYWVEPRVMNELAEKAGRDFSRRLREEYLEISRLDAETVEVKEVAP